VDDVRNTGETALAVAAAASGNSLHIEILTVGRCLPPGHKAYANKHLTKEVSEALNTALDADASTFERALARGERKGVIYGNGDVDLVAGEGQYIGQSALERFGPDSTGEEMVVPRQKQHWKNAGTPEKPGEKFDSPKYQASLLRYHKVSDTYLTPIAHLSGTYLTPI